nr:hypothetical protein [Melaminivora suipulveris]
MSSHHDYIIEITAQHDALKPFAPENSQPLRFKVGDAAIYTNEFGAQFRRRVTGFYQPTEPSGLYARGRRYYLNSTSPWMPVAESSLRPDGALRATLASRGKPCWLSPPRDAWRPSKTAEPAEPDRPDRSSHRHN